MFKDYDYPGDLFKDKDGNKLTYDKFYTTDGEESKVIEDNVELFLNNLTVKMVSASDSNKDNEVPNSVVIKVMIIKLSLLMQFLIQQLKNM